VVVGPDYRFGRDRAGDLPALRRWGDELGFAVHAVAAVSHGGEPVSSTRIRTLLRAGRVREAAELLGRPPLLAGRVVRGAGVGRKLGYPTANLDTDPDCAQPAEGIFAAYACLDGPRRAAVYLGTRPTFRGGRAVVEVHLMDGSPPDLYGVQLHVHLVEKIRDDAAFDDAGALRAQIARDIAAVERALDGAPPPAACALPTTRP
jgi:riboflavin kinase/FMN adenylyltransferase